MNYASIINRLNNITNILNAFTQGNKKISELDELNSISNNDLIVVENNNVANKIKFIDFYYAVAYDDSNLLNLINNINLQISNISSNITSLDNFLITINEDIDELNDYILERTLKLENRPETKQIHIGQLKGSVDGNWYSASIFKGWSDSSHFYNVGNNITGNFSNNIPSIFTAPSDGFIKNITIRGCSALTFTVHLLVILIGKTIANQISILASKQITTNASYQKYIEVDMNVAINKEQRIFFFWNKQSGIMDVDINQALFSIDYKRNLTI